MHSHGHDKALINRISKSVGHLESIKNMIESGKDCAEILIQLSAVRGELVSLSKVIIKEHLSHCIAHAIEDGDTKKVDEFKNAIDTLIK